MREEKKYVILGSLCALLVTMTVAYAAFQSSILVKGTSNITSKWDILITDVKETNKGGSAETVGTPTWTELKANIEANIYEKGDFIEYEVTVENRGTLDSKLEGINESLKEENKAVKITLDGYTKGQKLEKGTSQIVKVKIEYNPDFTGEIEEGSTEISLDLNYTQNNDYKKEEDGEITSPDRYLVKYDCTTNGGEKCTNFNEYLKEGESINLTNQGTNKKYDFIGWNTDPTAREGLTELQMTTEEVTLYAIYETDPIIQSWTNTDITDFHSAAYKQSIISAEFLDNKNIPENATESWDVSAAKDKSVMAWVVPDETDNTKHHLYIGGKGGVIANEDSSWIFYQFTNITSIEFHNNFDTSNTTNMQGMFSGCNSLFSLNVSKFDTSKVTNIRSMFDNCKSLENLDLSNFDTKNVITIRWMFSNCSNLKTLNISNFNTSKVEDMQQTFGNCTSLTKINICSFDTRNTTNMYQMFAGTSALNQVYVGPNWTTANVTDTTSMWSNSKISSVTKSDNCAVEAEDPATINISTTSTTKSITVVVDAKAESGIAKYEYQIDGGEWIEGTGNLYTFNDLEQNAEYHIKVRVTSKIGKQTTSSEIKVTTNALGTPTFEETENGTGGKKVTITYPEGCGDKLTCSYQKDEGDWIEVNDQTKDIIFSESGVVVAKVTDGTNEVTASHTVVFEGNNLEYNGEVQTFTADKDGYYKVELWGAQGGSTSIANGGKGSYTSGEIYLKTGDTLYIHIGNQSTDVKSTVYNGGGISNSDGRYRSGGGATDIRTKEGAWNDATSLNSRIMVAAGGGGAYLTNTSNDYLNGAAGGDLIGNLGKIGICSSTNTAYCGTIASKGGIQTSGGAGGTGGHTNGNAGSFGFGGNGNGCCTAGGGSGYYGGGSSGVSNNQAGSGAGGSSYISGYAGVNSITSESDRTHTNQTKHYSDKYFINTEMQAGVNSGNGKAKITYLKVPSSKDSTKIKGVRYIKDCTNGSSGNKDAHWMEIQAINKGINVAKGKTVTGFVNGTEVEEVNNTTDAFINAVDGIMDNSNQFANFASITVSGLQCLVIDLGKEYDLEEIAIWHYYADGRTYYHNSTQVAGEDKNYRVIYNEDKAETSNGNRIRKDNILSAKDKNITIGYTKGGAVKLSRNKDTINITATPSTNFTYQGATLVCDDKTTKEISGKTFKTSECSGDITVYPTWKRNDYIWNQNTYQYWHVYSYDVVKLDLYYNSAVNQTKFETTSSNSRNIYATNSAMDLTDYSQWSTNIHCYNWSNVRLDQVSTPSYAMWKNVTNSPASWGTQNLRKDLFANDLLDISSYNGTYYLQLHWIVNGGGFWCAWLGNSLIGETYSYENPF